MPKSKALTISKVTSQVAARVRPLMVDVLVTINTSKSYDIATDKATFATAVTFPPKHPCAVLARAAVLRIPGVLSADVNPSTGYLTIVREA